MITASGEIIRLMDSSEKVKRNPSKNRCVRINQNIIERDHKMTELFMRQYNDRLDRIR